MCKRSEADSGSHFGDLSVLDRKLEGELRPDSTCWNSDGNEKPIAMTFVWKVQVRASKGRSVVLTCCTHHSPSRTAWGFHPWRHGLCTSEGLELRITQVFDVPDPQENSPTVLNLPGSDFESTFLGKARDIWRGSSAKIALSDVDQTWWNSLFEGWVSTDCDLEFFGNLMAVADKKELWSHFWARSNLDTGGPRLNLHAPLRQTVPLLSKLKRNRKVFELRHTSWSSSSSGSISSRHGFRPS